MNYTFDRLKNQNCLNIIQNKDHGILTICNYDDIYSELVFYDTDCFCGCLTLYFNICKCGQLAGIIDNNDTATLVITRRCGNTYETVTLEGTLEEVEEEKCCCQEREKCFKTIKFDITNMCGKKYCRCA